MTTNENNSAKSEKNYPTCGAKTRAGTTCKKPAGWGTDHPGVGKCKLHGGASTKNIKHGYYSKYLNSGLADKIDELAIDKDLLDLRRTIAMHKALILDILGRLEEGKLKLDKGTIKVLNELADKLGRNTERLNKIEVGQKYVLEIREVQNIVNQVVMVVEQEVEDPKIIKKIAGKLK